MDTVTLAPPRAVRWDKSLYHQMGEMGWFDVKPVELIEGEIIEMSPISSPHFVVVQMVQEALMKAFDQNRFTVNAQAAINVGPASEPQPDVVVLKGRPREHLLQLPESAELVVEVAISSLDYDRGIKANLYARAGIADYWVVNVSEGEIDVYRHPVEDTAALTGWQYSVHTTYQRDESISPLAATASGILVADILP